MKFTNYEEKANSRIRITLKLLSKEHNSPLTDSYVGLLTNKRMIISDPNVKSGSTVSRALLP